MNNKKLTYDEFVKYIKTNGQTYARTTEKFQQIPVGTKIAFGLDSDGYLTSYEDSIKNILVLTENIPVLRYAFDIEWDSSWLNTYTGLFEIDNPLAKRKIFVGNYEMSAKVHEKLYELGCERNEYYSSHEGFACIYIHDNLRLAYGNDFEIYIDNEYSELGLQELFKMKSEKQTKTIILDGKSIEISIESFGALKNIYKEIFGDF